MGTVCWQCIEDEYLKQIVKDSGTRATCDLCSKKRKSFTAENLAEIVDPILQEHLRIGEDEKRFGNDDEEWWEQTGDPLDYHLQEVFGQYFGFEDEIVTALEENDPADLRDGDVPFYDGSQNYLTIPIRPHSLYTEWADVSEDLKYRRRFFSSAAADLFERLFKDIETRVCSNTETSTDEKVVWEMPQGSLLFRARICQSEESIKEAYKEPLKHIGPPPPEYTPAGRMNVNGVAVFYGALDADTCLAEVRPSIGNDVVIIQLCTTKPLRLLDFRRLERSYEKLSYFQADFKEQAERGAFLRRLQTLISQPVIPGGEMDYLVTQTMAEYLAHVFRPRLDGVLFKSVQRSGGTNTVLFQEGANGFPLLYAKDSFELHTTTSVEYKHRKRYVHQHEDGEVWIARDLDDGDNDYYY